MVPRRRRRPRCAGDRPTDPQRFTEFRRRYRLELATGEHAAALSQLAELAKGRTLTLLTASRDPAISEAAVLVELLDESPRRPISAR